MKIKLLSQNIMNVLQLIGTLCQMCKTKQYSIYKIAFSKTRYLLVLSKFVFTMFGAYHRSAILKYNFTFVSHQIVKLCAVLGVQIHRRNVDYTYYVYLFISKTRLSQFKFTQSDGKCASNIQLILY